MVLTRSKSNSQGTIAPVPAPATPKTTATKRKANTNASATSTPNKFAKTESAPDASAAKTAEPLPEPSTAVASETAATPAALSAPDAASIPAPVDVPVMAITEPKVASSEEPTVHTSSVKKLKPFDIVVSDIEGTTTPIVFVKENLFPYVTTKLADFLQRNWDSTEMKSAIEALRVQAAKDIADGLADAVPIAVESAENPAAKVQQDVIACIGWQMKADRKIGALKSFQGYIWREGYANGDLKGAVYEDVLPAFDQWKAEGKKLYIYSSGSIAAQKLLFGYSEKGDALHYFSGHYDTTIGLKVESESYSKIAKDIGVDPARILFLSDNIHEIVAAQKAGMQAVVTDRPGNAPLSEEERSSNIVVKSFLEIPRP